MSDLPKLVNFCLVVFSICIFELQVQGAAVWKEDERPLVTLPQGQISGITESFGNITYNSFRRIPFAKPPVKELRFMPPVPAESWDGILDGQMTPPPCPQFDQHLKARENCLYLNVYTPKDIDMTTPDTPVLVWYHGGGFLIGNTMKYDPPYLLVDHGVIVVSIQYRLGVLGFFSTGDSVAPGNAGLMDQTLGLQWVHDNIQYFGGDSNRVVLFGQSAGAASVHFQMLTPSAQGLFQGSIMDSGSAFSPWATGREFEENAVLLANTFDCPNDTSAALVECLQEVNYLLLSDFSILTSDWNVIPFKFCPRIDGEYLPDHPAVLMRDGNFNQVPIMMGSTREDGCILSGEMYTDPLLINSLVRDFPANGGPSLFLFEGEDPLTIPSDVYNHYLGHINITKEDAYQLTKLYTHNLFHIPMDRLAKEASKYVSTWLYETHTKGTKGIVDTFIELGMDIPGAEEWVCHGDDLKTYLPSRVLEDPNEVLLAERVATMFTNFAKLGNPTPDEETLGFIWPPADDFLFHLVLDEDPRLQEDYRKDDREFWESLPLIINNHIPN